MPETNTPKSDSNANALRKLLFGEGIKWEYLRISDSLRIEIPGAWYQKTITEPYGMPPDSQLLQELVVNAILKNKGTFHLHVNRVKGEYSTRENVEAGTREPIVVLRIPASLVREKGSEKFFKCRDENQKECYIPLPLRCPNENGFGDFVTIEELLQTQRRPETGKADLSGGRPRRRG